jgi:hypothetical protein
VIFVAIPAYDGRICVETARALLNEQSAAKLAGVELQIAFLPGCSLITHARNQLVQDFLDSECARLVFVDSDVAWEPGALLRLAGHTADVVGGAYRLKQDDEAYPVVWLDRPELWAENGLLEVRSLPGGFLSISREALTKLRDAHPGRGYSHYGKPYHGFFHAPIRDGGMYGEDAAFCADWLDLGGKLWLDPELKLTHVGGHKAFAGCIGDWLRSR